MMTFDFRRQQRAYLVERLRARALVMVALREATQPVDQQALRARLRMIRRQIRTACIEIRHHSRLVVREW